MSTPNDKWPQHLELLTDEGIAKFIQWKNIHDLLLEKFDVQSYAIYFTKISSTVKTQLGSVFMPMSPEEKVGLLLRTVTAESHSGAPKELMEIIKKQQPFLYGKLKEQYTLLVQDAEVELPNAAEHEPIPNDPEVEKKLKAKRAGTAQ